MENNALAAAAAGTTTTIDNSGLNLMLPNFKILSPHTLGFLDKHFHSDYNLSSISSTSRNLEIDLTTKCEKLDSDLINLQGSLGKLIVSWICNSIGAKTALHKLNLNLQNLSRIATSHYGVGSKKIAKMLTEDLPRLAKELRRIDNIRSYCETTLKLEALVGDFEDAVIFVLKSHVGDNFSSKAPISTDLAPRQKELLQAINTVSVIENLMVSVAKIHPQWLHLTKSVDTRVNSTLAILRAQVVADHRALLASLGWPPKVLTSKIEYGTISHLPNPLVLMQVDKRKRYSESFLVLCALQHLQTQREERDIHLLGHKNGGNVGLWAIDELVSPIASRTEYHFSKWVDQPELIFTLVSKITREFVVGVDDVLQPLIDKARLVSYSAKEAWVYAMVQMLSGFLGKKVFSLLAERYKDKSMRSEIVFSWIRLIDLMVAFDRQMQSLVNTETCLFSGIGGFEEGISVLSIFCDRPDWLKIWAKIELKDAWKKLKAELKDEGVWLIDNNPISGFSTNRQTQELLYSREDYKAPLIAESVLKYAWQMTERCQNLPAISLRIQFIRSTSARLIWYFFNVLVLRWKRVELNSECPAEDSLTRLCLSINAARYCEFKLLAWSDSMNLLGMRIPENDLEDDENDSSCFFGEDIKSLVELETAWLMEVIANLLRQFETLSWQYVQAKGLFETNREEFGTIIVLENMDLTVSVDFVEALDALRSQLHVIRTNLNPKDFFDLWRSVADGLDHFIFCSILMSDYRFSDDGIKQFSADMQALFLVFQPFCFRPDAFFPCLRDSLKLLKMGKEEVKHLLVVKNSKWLGSFGISHLSFDQVGQILRNRKSGI